jgi:hypothetical protein
MQVKGELKDAQVELMTAAEVAAATPKPGRRVHDTDNQIEYIGDGSQWVRIVTGVIDDLTIVKSGQTIKQRDSNYDLSSGIQIGNTDKTGSWSQYTDTVVSITTIGRPVLLMLIDGGTGNSEIISENGASGSDDGQLAFYRDATKLTEYSIRFVKTNFSSSFNSVSLPPGCIMHVDFPGAGTYSYSLYGRNSGADMKVAPGTKLLAIEL